jgi:wyosine [tRNA(Phe)-imidazoG37] synthetase (radical SAM superfamily)
MCFTKQINHKEKIIESYNADEFEAILKKYSRNLIYIMFGCLWEPTLNKDIYTMLKLCRKYKVLPFLTTNFIDCNVNNLIKAEIPYIQVSISAGDKNSYINIHGRDFFEKVINNLFNITNKKHDIYIHVKSVLQKANEDLNTIKKLRRFLKKIKVNKFSLKKFQSVRDILDNIDILPENKDFFDKKSGLLRFSTDKRNYS